MKPRIFTHIAATPLFGALLAVSPTAAQDESTLSSAPRQYTVTVLPGLGGLGGAFNINNLGWASGVSMPPGDLYDRAFLWRNGQATDLGTLGGYNSSAASNKNEIGWVAGASETGGTDPFQENFCGFSCSSQACLPPYPICKGFLWRSKTNEMIALPPLPGGNNSSASGANNQHQVVGWAENGVQDSNCVAPQVLRFEGVVWSLGSDGTPFVSRRLSPIANDTISAALAINQVGDIVGGTGPCGPASFASGKHSVLWKKDGSVTDLGNLGGSRTT